MIVCDICGRKEVTKVYTIPMKTWWYATHNGIKTASFPKYEIKSVDLCKNCAKAIADIIDELQCAHQKKEEQND